MRPYHFITLLSCVVVVSCTQTTTKNHLESSPTEESFQSRIAGGFSYKKDSEGNLVVCSDRRSTFEGDKYDPKGKSFDRKSYDTGKYDTKSFDDSSRQFTTSQWSGNKSYDKDKLNTPEFVKKSKGVETKSWDERNKSFATNRSEHQGKSHNGFNEKFETKTNSYVEDRRNRYEKPRIISSAENQAMTIAETRSMLGRDNNND